MKINDFLECTINGHWLQLHYIYLGVEEVNIMENKVFTGRPCRPKSSKIVSANKQTDRQTDKHSDRVRAVVRI